MADPKKTPEKSEKPAPLAAVAKRYEQALPHVAAEMAAHPAEAAPASPLDAFKRALMDAVMQLEAVGKAQMMGKDTVAAKQHVLVGMLAEVTPKPAKK
jgi:hypothetical protein